MYQAQLAVPLDVLTDITHIKGVCPSEHQHGAPPWASALAHLRGAAIAVPHMRMHGFAGHANPWNGGQDYRDTTCVGILSLAFTATTSPVSTCCPYLTFA